MHESILQQAKNNVERNLWSLVQRRRSYHKLTWGDTAEVQELPETDILLGADIAYYPDAHEALLDTIEALIVKRESGFALFCHPER